MNKKIIAIIAAIAVIIAAVIIVVSVTGDKPANSDDGSTSPSNGENIIVDNENKGDSDSQTPGTDKEENIPGNSDANNNVSENEKPSGKDEQNGNNSDSSKEPTDNDEEKPTCQYCGKEVKPNNGTSTEIGAFCDGYCEEWLG